MMNDTQFIEAARHLATNSLKTASQDKERISKMFRKLTARIPNETEMSIMIDVLNKHRAEYKMNIKD